MTEEGLFLFMNVFTAFIYGIPLVAFVCIFLLLRYRPQRTASKI